MPQCNKLAASSCDNDASNLAVAQYTQFTKKRNADASINMQNELSLRLSSRTPKQHLQEQWQQ